MTNAELTFANNFNFKHFDWKYYNSIKKKAMEQEFSWSGLILSLSIAFFIVIAASLALSTINQSIERASTQKAFLQEHKICQLEVFNDYNKGKYLQPVGLNQEKIEGISSLGLA